MKFIILIAIFVAAFAVSSPAQVDTLTANEIGTITLPDSIRQLYIQDLDRDSLREIILCTVNHVYVYRADNDQPIWVSPELVCPGDLQFADINGDSLIDIAVRDSANISLFNPHDSTLIYSTTIPSLFRCYTIGDVNNDSYGDLAVVTQEPFDASNREDSIWTDISYGPNFGSHVNFSITMANYAYQDPGGQYRISFGQHADKILIANMGIITSLSPRIIITSIILAGLFAPSPDEVTDGGFWIINPSNFTTIYHQQIGLSDTLYFTIFQNYRVLISTLYILHTYSPGYYPNLYGYVYKQLVGRFSASGIIDTTRLVYDAHESVQYPHIPFWSYCFGELNNNGISNKLCFGLRDSLKEYSVNNRIMLWSIRAPVDSFEVKDIINHSALFPSTEIIIKETEPIPQYLFINGQSYQIDALLPDLNPLISQIADINSDGNDELLSLAGNILNFYSLARATSVFDDSSLPLTFFLEGNYPNPFNAQTIIKYSIAEKLQVRLEIFDLLGRQIENIDDGEKAPGRYQITWDASAMPSGIYFYRLNAGNENKTGRMVLLK